jgi:cytidine deaminase
VPEGSENVAEKIFFGNAKRELCDATTNALMRSIDVCPSRRDLLARRVTSTFVLHARISTTNAPVTAGVKLPEEKSGIKITQVTDSELLNKAIEAAKRAYAPYSKFLVGAVVVTKDGQLFEGCNVENVSFGLTICAERNAVCAAVAAAYREFTKIVIATDLPEPASPCGACRQVLCEFNPDIEIVLGTFGGKMVSHRLSELLPHPCLGILDRR